MLRMLNALSVRTSQTVGFPLRRADGSYTVSMRCHGLPDRQNIRRCIRVAVVDCAAFRARPFPHAQRQFLNDVSAVGAGLRGREPSVDLDHGFAVPRGLLFDHADGRSDGCVVQRAGKAVVLGRAAQVEVFDADHIETGNEIGAQLVQRVEATVGDLLVDAGNMTLDLLAPLAALLRPGKALLVEGQPTLPSATADVEVEGGRRGRANLQGCTLRMTAGRSSAPRTLTPIGGSHLIRCSVRPAPARNVCQCARRICARGRARWRVSPSPP